MSIRYFDVYFPRAIETANLMREAGTDRFIYTTHPWLVSLYTDPNCAQSGIPEMSEIGIPLHCPNETELAAFEQVITSGDGRLILLTNIDTY